MPSVWPYAKLLQPRFPLRKMWCGTSYQRVHQGPEKSCQVVHFAPGTTPQISGDAQFLKKLKKKKIKKYLQKHLQPKFQKVPKSYVEATRIQDSSTDHTYVILSNFITNLNSLISPQITLLSSVLNALIPKVSLSPWLFS